MHTPMHLHGPLRVTECTDLASESFPCSQRSTQSWYSADQGSTGRMTMHSRHACMLRAAICSPLARCGVHWGGLR